MGTVLLGVVVVRVVHNQSLHTILDRHHRLLEIRDCLCEPVDVFSVSRVGTRYILYVHCHEFCLLSFLLHFLVPCCCYLV